MNALAELRRLARSLSRVAQTRYPRFLLGLPVDAGEIPVFVYHDVEPAAFERDLVFLRDNGYRTLGAAEFLRASRSGAGRCVLLTFDDARRNFHEVALPLLRRYGAQATLFVPTAWIRDEATTPDGLDRSGFMSWSELAECVASSQVDLGSHGHRHTLVPVRPRLVGFASPAALARYDLYDWPMRHEQGAERLGPPPLGTPVYESEPLLSAATAALPEPHVAAACRELVAREGGAAFFADPRWPQRLAAEHDRAVGAGSPLRPLAQDALAALQASEFDRSWALFRERLSLTPTLFAYPWMLGSERSLELAARAGARVAFGVGIDYGRSRRVASPIPVFGRLKGDWLRFLPGRGRASLPGTVTAKALSLLGTSHLAH